MERNFSFDDAKNLIHRHKRLQARLIDFMNADRRQTGFEEAADDLQDGKSVRCFESVQPVAHFLTRGWKQTSKTIPW